MAKTTSKKTVETITDDEAKRKNIPSAEHQSVLAPSASLMSRLPGGMHYHAGNPKGGPWLD